MTHVIDDLDSPLPEELNLPQQHDERRSFIIDGDGDTLDTKCVSLRPFYVELDHRTILHNWGDIPIITVMHHAQEMAFERIRDYYYNELSEDEINKYVIPQYDKCIEEHDPTRLIRRFIFKPRIPDVHWYVKHGIIATSAVTGRSFKI